MTPEQTERLLDYNGSDRILTFQQKREMVDKTKESKPLIHLTTRMEKFNKAIRFFAPGDLILVTGRPKSGKTLLCQTLTLDFQMQHDVSSLWFEYEVTPEMFLESFPGNVLPLIGYLPNEYRTGSTNWVEERIKEALVKDEILNGQRTLYCVFIDHIHFVFDIFKSRNPSIELGQIVRQLKTIAIENDLIIFLMSHMRKTELEKEPSAYDARDTGFMIAECDKALTMWRLKNEENVGVLKLDVDRRTGALSKKFKIIKNYEGYLCEVEEMREEHENAKEIEWNNK